MDEDEALISFVSEPPPLPLRASAREDTGWFPALTDPEIAVFNDPSPNILVDGNKGSGKTHICLVKLVRHCYEAGDGKNTDPITALAIIMVRSYNTGDIGVWYEFEHVVLPTWRDGNRAPAWTQLESGLWIENPHAGQMLDDGIGLEYTATKMDPKTKASKIYIRNRFGGLALVVLMSVPHAVMIEARMKGFAPTFVLVEELTDCETRKYHSFPSAQLNRRRGTGNTPHQYVASCNPAGPLHWVYKLWFEDKHCTDPEKRDPRFSRHFIPLSSNICHVGPEYMNRLLDAFGHDMVDRARLIDGIWMDRPTGAGIFRDDYAPAVHVIGDAARGIGIHPKTAFPILVGMDPGVVNFSVHFLQMIPTKDRGIVWMVFDELNFVGQYVPYHRVVPAIMRRLAWWCRLKKHVFFHEDISDEAAFNQTRSDGNPDYVEIERLSRAWCLRNPDPAIAPLRLKRWPQGANRNDSVPARVRTVSGLLQQQQLVISDTCTKTKEMFLMLESERDDDAAKYDPHRGLRPRKSVFVHSFDSLSYPIFYYHTSGAAYGVTTGRVVPQVYECGSGG